MGKDKVKMWYDEESDILYVSFKEGESVDSEEIKEDLRVGYNKNGEVIGVEISNISEFLAKSLSKKLRSAIA